MSTFGEKLRHARESRETTLEEIARRTEIGQRFLEALEREEFDVAIIGGHINASDTITITADGGVTETGSQVLAFNDLIYNAPTVTITGLEVPTLVNRPNGLLGLFQEDYVWSYYEDRGGQLIAGNNVVFNTSSPVEVEAGVVSWGNDLIAANGLNQAAPTVSSPVGDYYLGLFHELFE